MKRLLIKELRLAMHPTAPIFLALSAMLLIPSYPYPVAFFYTGLAVFFTCLNGRENQDVFFTLLLPVSKRSVVRARFASVMLLEAAQVLAAVPFAVIRQRLIPGPNPVGMDANAALLGFVLVQLGLFNRVFFGVYYRDVRRVGAAFVWSSAAVFAWICLAESSAHVLPFVRDVLDTPDPQHMGAKMLTLLGGAALWAVLSLRAYRRAAADFDRQDL